MSTGAAGDHLVFDGADVEVADAGRRISSVMVAAGLAKSNAEAARLISQGAAKVDGTRVADKFDTIPAEQAPFTLQVGRRARRIRPFRPTSSGG